MHNKSILFIILFGSCLPAFGMESPVPAAASAAAQDAAEKIDIRSVQGQDLNFPGAVVRWIDYHQNIHMPNGNPYNDTDSFWTKFGKGFTRGFWSGPEQLGAQAFNLLITAGIGIGGAAINKFIVNKLVGLDQEVVKKEKYDTQTLFTNDSQLIERIEQIVQSKKQELESMRTYLAFKHELMKEAYNENKSALEKEAEELEKTIAQAATEIQEMEKTVHAAKSAFVQQVQNYMHKQAGQSGAAAA